MMPATPVPLGSHRAALIRDHVLSQGGSEAEADELLRPKEMWMNDRYVATVERFDGHVSVISLRRIGRKAVRDWRDMQAVKNDIAGFEVEAVELFPAESRLVDTANQYWLWCLPSGERWPFGFKDRVVAGPDVASPFGAVQRGLS